MCHSKLRPFGEKKVLELVEYLTEYKSIRLAFDNTASKMGIAILKKWIELYDINKFDKNDSYIKVKQFLDNVDYDISNISVGARKLNYEEMENYIGFDYNSAIKSRKSVRDFTDKQLKLEDIEYCINAALLTPTACNRQMVKIYYINNKNKKEKLMPYIMGLSGFNKNNVNFFIVTYDISAFSFYGERMQGMLNTGLVSMNFVNAMHFKGIGSCFLQWGNKNKEELEIKKLMGIKDCERIGIIIGAGYYPKETIIPLSQRKDSSEIYIEVK